MRSLHIIYASTSGHTEYVIDALIRFLSSKVPSMQVERQRAELAHPKDLLRGDVLILGSGTWNTGGTEGQLNMHMHALLKDRAKDLDLCQRPIAFISLGDERYYYRTRCTEHFLRFQREHNATLFIPPLVLVNDPYGQEEKIQRWGDKLLTRMQHGETAHISKHALSSTSTFL